MASVLSFFAALFAVLNRDTLSPGLAGLSISNSLAVCVYYNYFIKIDLIYISLIFSKISNMFSIMVLMTSRLETSATSVERILEYSQLEHEVKQVLNRQFQANLYQIAVPHLLTNLPENNRIQISYIHIS